VSNPDLDSPRQPSAGADAPWRPTVAHFRAVAGAIVLIAVALLWRRPDALIIATPLAVVATWSMLTRPTTSPALDDRLGNSTIREGDATTWYGDVMGSDVDVAVAVLDDSPWIDAKPSSGVATVLAANGTADLRIGVRSTRWGVRPLERVHVVAATPWAAFRWAVVTTPLPLTTLPLPAVFDARADARPSDGLIGLHRSARGGEGNEFAGIRPFHVGDRMRRINWPRSIRAGELHVNSTWADLDTHIALVVDATADFGASEGVDGLASSLDGAVRAAGAIAEHYALRGERVSVRAFGTVVSRAVRPASGRAQLRRILDTLALVTPADTSRTGYRTPAGQARGTSGGRMTVMLSPLIAPEALDLAMSLGRQGMPVIIVDTLPDHVTDDDDPFTALAWRIRLLERRRELRLVLAAGIPVVVWRGPGSLDHVIRDVSARSAGPRMTPR
jgi:uncharacterized protein (DUF58 family)